MEYKPNKRDLWIALSVAVSGLLVFIIFGFVTFMKVGDVGLEINNNTEAGLRLQTALSTKKQIGDMALDISNLDSFFINNSEEAYFLNDLGQLAKSNKVKLSTDSIQVGDTSSTDFKDTLTVNIKYEGPWTNVIGFLRSVENMPKATMLGAVELNAKDGTPGVWEGGASLSVYKLK